MDACSYIATSCRKTAWCCPLCTITHIYIYIYDVAVYMYAVLYSGPAQLTKVTSACRKLYIKLRSYII